jgi:hypothetical protein
VWLRRACGVPRVGNGLVALSPRSAVWLRPPFRPVPRRLRCLHHRARHALIAGRCADRHQHDHPALLVGVGSPYAEARRRATPRRGHGNRCSRGGSGAVSCWCRTTVDPVSSRCRSTSPTEHWSCGLHRSHRAFRSSFAGRRQYLSGQAGLREVAERDLRRPQLVRGTSVWARTQVGGAERGGVTRVCRCGRGGEGCGRCGTLPRLGARVG